MHASMDIPSSRPPSRTTMTDRPTSARSDGPSGRRGWRAGLGLRREHPQWSQRNRCPSRWDRLVNDNAVAHR